MTDPETKSQKFVTAFSEVDELLSELITQNNPISMSLKQLSKLHHMQRQLEQFKFLNIVYSDSSRMRKVFTHQATQQLDLQKTLCTSIDLVVNDFLKHFKKLDKMILHIINMQLTQNSFSEIVNNMFRTIFCSQEFTLIYNQNQEVEVLFSGSQDSHYFSKSQALEIFAQYKTKESGFDTTTILLGSTLVVKTKSALLLIHESSTTFSKEYLTSLSFLQLQTMMDELLAIIFDNKQEMFQREPLVFAMRGIKSILIKNSQFICEQILKSQIESSLNTKCVIHHKDSVGFKQLQVKNINEISFSNTGNLILPVKIQKDIYFYLEAENIVIDIITFSDYIQQQWQNLTFKVRDLKQQEFQNQLIEVNTPNKLFIGVDEKMDIIYQSGPVPSSWSFIEIPNFKLDTQPNFKEIKMEQVYKKMLTDKIFDLKESGKAAIECGSIYFADRQVDIDIYVRRDESDQNQMFYIVFDQPRKKMDESLPVSSKNINSDLAQEVLTSLKAEKIEKACNILREQLKITLDTDEIVEMLKERELENEMFNQENITQEIRDSYVFEYYKTDTRPSVQLQRIIMPMEDQFECPSPYRTQKIVRDQLTNVKKLDLFTLDLQDYNKLSDWEFTSLNLPQDQSAERIRIVWAMFQLSNYMEIYQISRDTFYQFLIVIQERYNSKKNPFHNFDHAVQVSHACFFFIKNKLMNTYLDQIEQFTALFSALCHDLDHTGRTNAFELAKQSKLAIRYNDDSVLENHHVSSTFKIMSKDKCNILQNINDEQQRIIRKYTISNILATDMKKHFELIKQIELKIAKQHESNEAIIQKDEDKRLFSGIVIHICDLAGPAKNYNLAQQWSLRICEEFTAQVEDEKSLGLPVTSYLQNLTNTLSIAKNEISFIRVIIKPLYELAVQLVGPKLLCAVSNLETNQKEWEAILQKQAQ